MTKLALALTILTAALVGACSGGDTPEEKAPSAGAHADEGPHGGQTLELGDHVAHIEVVHQETAGKITIYVFGSDLRTPLSLAKPPQIKLMTQAGPQVIATQPQDAEPASVFVATDAAFETHELEGRITVEIDGTVYNPILECQDDH